jgi:hypothetical protein
MDEYSVDVLPGEVLAWVRADVARMVPRLSVRAAKSYWIDEVSSGESAKPAEGDDVSPVMVRGVMELTPQQGCRGWTLQLVAQDSVGLREDGEDAAAWRRFGRWLARQRARNWAQAAVFPRGGPSQIPCRRGPRQPSLPQAGPAATADRGDSRPSIPCGARAPAPSLGPSRRR